MAKRIEPAKSIYDRVPDWIWPHLTGDEIPEPSDRNTFNADHARLADQVDSIVSFRLAQAEDHSRTVDTKLASMLTFTSVLMAAVIGSLAAATTLVRIQDKDPVWPTCLVAAVTLVALLLVIYLVAQIIRSLQATVRGLRRRQYRRLGIDDLAPRDRESSEAYRIRLLNTQINCMVQNEWAVARKVDEMEIAYIAVRNALPAAFILIAVSLAVVVGRLVWN